MGIIIYYIDDYIIFLSLIQYKKAELEKFY